MVKFCKDCKWVERSGAVAKCNAPQNMEHSTDLVTGETTTKRRWIYCDQRTWGWLKAFMWNACGPQARWFEPRSEEQLREDRRP